ncbi:MAG: twin-arginine translocation signal domain-containing protein, partial [Chloroflexi bacterium]|nr:twin-arginine translocation signal domain-containing protein [Chloroflexota bacterium]
MKKNHPWFYEISDYVQQDRLSRREFIRYAALLGVSATAASQTVGLFTPHQAQAANIKRGGILRTAASVMKIKHPAQTSWGQQSNQLQQLLEFLVVTDADNIAHPHLLEGWEVSDDLKTWTLNLRRGITFNNGDEFMADDVVFAFNQWLNKDIASTMRTLFSPILSEAGVEKVNQYQVKLHLDKPDIGVPYYLNESRALIVNHRTFEGDILKAPHGTGPYLLESYTATERVVFKRRDDYWQKGADGQPLPYLDGQ